MRAVLEAVLSPLGPSAIAFSGGVDTITLAVLANRLLCPENVEMKHADTTALPPEATGRVREWASRESWNLRILDAGEFSDRNYMSNPVNRCFFCKGNLYGTIASLTDRQILSGANMDDLGEYRPGLDAARDHGVRHPYVEAGIDKTSVRVLARDLGLGDLAELPASPCLSSRVETLIAIDPELLKAVHGVERLVAERLSPKTVRCRVRRSGVVVELDAASLERAGDEMRDALLRSIAGLLPSSLSRKPIGFEAYRNGSAFVGARV
jgi:uncharacterized protein